MKTLLIICFNLYLVHVSCQNGNTTEFCTIEGNIKGTCIPQDQCQSFMKKFNNRATFKEALQMQSQRRCGFDGFNQKLCCPVSSDVRSLLTTKKPTTTVKPVYLDSFPEPPVCGGSSVSYNKIQGGFNASLGDYPWMVILAYKELNNYTSWRCGGSIITKSHVLTAAHCVNDQLYVARVGELDLWNDTDGANPIDYLIAQKIVHEEYVVGKNDIAILLLDGVIEFTELIHPICLPRTAELRSKTFQKFNPFVAGWGRLYFQGPQANHLQAVQVPVVSTNKCKEAFKRNPNATIDEKTICAGVVGKDSCSGDSGGPLMIAHSTNPAEKAHYYIIGTVSFSMKCAKQPGVYMRVTHYLPWIEKKVLGYSTSSSE